MDRLFVYGTLRSGTNNEHARKLAESARYLGPAKIRGRLFRIENYPGLIAPALENEWVKGDVFEMVTADVFERLDEYEGAEYVRELATVTREDGNDLVAYLYLYTNDTDGLELISSGDWNDVTSPSSPLE